MQNPGLIRGVIVRDGRQRMIEAVRVGMLDKWGAVPVRGNAYTCSAAAGTRAPPTAILAPRLALFCLLSCPCPSNTAPLVKKVGDAGLRGARGSAANAAALSIPEDEDMSPGVECIGAKAATGAAAKASMARSQGLSILPGNRGQRWD